MKHNTNPLYCPDPLCGNDCSQTSPFPERHGFPSLSGVRLARSFRDQSQGDEPGHSAPEPPNLPTLLPLPMPALSCPPSPEPVAPKPKRIPRPPNAFMLFRSDLIKNGRIPKNVEHRQQTLSCVAGECWNLLKEEERKEWQIKAAEKFREHQLKYPDYKFAPAPKGISKKGKGRNDVVESKDRVRALREKYMQISGPAQPTHRRQTRKARRFEHVDDIPSGMDSSPESSPTPLPSPMTPPPLQPLSFLPREYDNGSMPMEFPCPSVPHYFEDRGQTLPPATLSTEDSMATSYFNQLSPQPSSEPSSVAPSAPSSDIELAQYIGALDIEAPIYAPIPQFHCPNPRGMIFNEVIPSLIRYSPTPDTLNGAVNAFQSPFLVSQSVGANPQETPMIDSHPYPLYPTHSYSEVPTFQFNPYEYDATIEYTWREESHDQNA
ncbi:hypothetical protein Moror_17490 [Moniliophthora roreri MCA 2997]|uniref:HMG box domain-containing protein n=2 Tax=Moniliophthora roreri TaxID=221103 RepID=V2XEN5_MONRO|nr:hypothetical protein Moror_17490 [Moniliophthora roreri MCA 2997]KAI3612493.1 hypothetical protein WG66_009869 [Moniliophthora roreri]